MAQLGEKFNAGEYESMQDFSPLPAGDYVVAMVESEVKSTKDGSGQYLNCKFEVIDGQYKGRYLFTLLNLWNANPQAVSIAKRELATIGKACGVLSATDSAEFHGRPLVTVVGIEPASGNFGPKNKIKNYKEVDAPASAAPAAPAAVSPLAAARPWERKQ